MPPAAEEPAIGEGEVSRISHDVAWSAVVEAKFVGNGILVGTAELTNHLTSG